MSERLRLQGSIDVPMLDGSADFVPLKSFDETEIEMFRASPAGVVKLVRQTEGQQVGQIMVEDATEFEDPTERAYIAEHVGMAELGSAWHLMGQNGPDVFEELFGRRNWRYYRLATGDPETPPTTDHVWPASTLSMMDGVIDSQLLLGAYMRSPSHYPKQAKKTARTFGRAASALAVATDLNGLKQYGPEVTDVMAQEFSMRKAEKLKASLGAFAAKHGVNASIAAFAPANRDSEYARHFRVNAKSKRVLELFDRAIAHRVIGIKQFFPDLN